ncbi:MAG: hypothetical protein Fur0044_00260 [Anaerolineae bacterium]
MQVLLDNGDPALHRSIQTVWPLDAEAAFGALPTPLRLHADPRYTGRGVTLAVVDTGFYPHPDLAQPTNRIRAWVDAVQEPVQVRYFDPDETPAWPGWDAAQPVQWHGLMTSAVAAGNGWLSHGLYRGLASEADLVLVQVRNQDTSITNTGLVRALRWLAEHGPALRVRVVNLSLGGEPVSPLAGNPIDQAIAALTAQNMSVVAAAGNDGERHLLPPATAPTALTVGGIDDKNTFDHHDLELWHSNYGQSAGGSLKPDIVAPSIWVAAPILPNTPVATEAWQLFNQRSSGEMWVERRLAEMKLVTPHYQHVDGTSFAAPITASVIATMLQANPSLSPFLIRDILKTTAHAVAGASPERQGAGAVDAGQAVAFAIREQHGPLVGHLLSPQVTATGITFWLHDHTAQQVTVLGSWDGWATPGLRATQVEPGFWQANHGPLAPGQYAYKFLVDNTHWLDDPVNPQKIPDGLGGLNSLLVVQKNAIFITTKL